MRPYDGASDQAAMSSGQRNSKTAGESCQRVLGFIEALNDDTRLRWASEMSGKEISGAISSRIGAALPFCSLHGACVYICVLDD